MIRDARSPDKLPRMDWYPQDYLSDPKLRTFKAVHHGVYRLLLDFEWVDGPLPNDHEELAAMGCVSIEEFPAVWAKVGRCFEECDGRLINKRLEAERARALAIRETKRSAGKKGGRRKADGKHMVSASQSPANQTANPSPSTVNRQPSPSSKHTSASADSEDVSAEVREVFDYWRAEMRAGSERVLLTPRRREKIRSRLRDGYSVADLRTAVDGCKRSPHHMGENPQGTKYDDLELILRNGDNVERFRAMAEGGQSSEVRRRVNANPRRAVREADLERIRRMEQEGTLPDTPGGMRRIAP